MADEVTVPPPHGSPEAMWLGCLCPVIDNHYGRGVRVDNDGPPVYIVDEDCPVHEGVE